MSESPRWLRTMRKTLGYSCVVTIWADGTQLWHIRKLSDAGLMLSEHSCIDTKSLCGEISEGWDLMTPVNMADPEQLCKKCHLAWLEIGRSFDD